MGQKVNNLSIYEHPAQSHRAGIPWERQMLLYDLCTAESKEKIGEVILDEPPKVGCNVCCAGATYRVTGIVWMQNVDSNSVSSGLLSVERG